MVITLLQNQTIILAAGQGFSLPWVDFPAEHENAQLVLDVKGLAPGGSLGVLPQVSFNTDSELNVGAAIALAATGVVVVNITPAVGPLGPLFRLQFSTGGAGVSITLSAWLTPKRQ